MAEFHPAWLVVRAHEGGFVNDAADPGGPTKYGISLRFLRGLKREEVDLDLDGDIDIGDVSLLSEDGAARLYEKYFWRPNGYQELHDQQVATKLLDMAVHLGNRGGNRVAQRALRILGWDVATDGYCGPRTLLALNGTPARRLVPAICNEQAETYQMICAASPNLEKYLKGWLRRAAWPNGKEPP